MKILYFFSIFLNKIPKSFYIKINKEIKIIVLKNFLHKKIKNYLKKIF